MIVATVALAGCAQPQPDTSVADANFEREITRINEVIQRQTVQLEAIRAAKVPNDYKTKIDKELVSILKDPDSRKVEYSATPYGSLVCGTVNAKNSFGGYTGRTPFTAYFSQNGDLMHLRHWEPEGINAAKLLGVHGDSHYVEYTLLKQCGFAP